MICLNRFSVVVFLTLLRAFVSCSISESEVKISTDAHVTIMAVVSVCFDGEEFKEVVSRGKVAIADVAIKGGLECGFIIGEELCWNELSFVQDNNLKF